MHTTKVRIVIALERGNWDFIGQNNTIIIQYQFNVLIYLGKSAMVPTIVGAGKMSLNRFHLGGFIKKM